LFLLNELTRFSREEIMTQPGPVVSRAFSLIRSSFLALWLASVWPFVAIAVCFLTTSVIFHTVHVPGNEVPLMTAYQSMGALTKLGLMLAFIGSVFLPRDLAAAGITIVVWSEFQGWKISPRLLFSRLGRILIRLLILSMTMGTVCLFASFLFGFPGILAAAAVGFVIPVLAAEDAKGAAAFKTGMRFSLKGYGALCLLYLVVSIISLAGILGGGAAFVALLPTSVGLWWVPLISGWLLFVAFCSLVTMVSATVKAVLFWDVRQVSRT
jgi:hypothetical protein